MREAAMSERDRWYSRFLVMATAAFLVAAVCAAGRLHADEGKAKAAPAMEEEYVEEDDQPGAAKRPAAESAPACEMQAAPAEQSESAKDAKEPSQQEVERAMADYEAEQQRAFKKLQADPQWKPSHEQTAVIKAGSDESAAELHNFCLNRGGNLLAVCGGPRLEWETLPGASQPTPKWTRQPGEIRVLSPDGDLMATWKVDLKPETICVHADGTLFVAGGGRMARLAPDGKVLATADMPNVMPDEPKEVKAAEEKDKPKEEPAEKPKKKGSFLGALVSAIVSPAKPPADEPEVPAEQQAYLKEMRKAATGLAVGDRDLFVACMETEGYGYAVWRTDLDFKNPQKVLSGLSGCCGQMDIAAHNGELWVAHNGRHKVERYDRDGKELSSFGKRDRKAAAGFGGCCEPKNVRFGPDGDVFCSESGPPTTVKRFSPEGEFRGVATLAYFEGGCVRATVEVSRDGSQIFVLDASKNAIRRFTLKELQPTHEQAAVLSIPREAAGQPVPIHTFCIGPDGSLLAASGGGANQVVAGPNGPELKHAGPPAGIRVLSPEGELRTTWPLEITPQAINVGPDGNVYVGGQGRLVKLDRSGKLLLEAAAPNAVELPPLQSDEQIEAEAAKSEPTTEEAKTARQKRVAELQEKQKAVRETYTQAARKLSELRSEEKAQDAKAVAEAQAEVQKQAAELIAVSRELSTLTTDAKTMALRKRAQMLAARQVNGIAVTDRDVFVACRSAKSFGMEVWRTDLSFAEPKKIVTELRGCCGQMDIQAHDGKLFVAENARHRVACYDRDGKMLFEFGGNERSGVGGFGSCCNPMNLRFGPDGGLYTSEASLGRIKRFSPEGKFLGLVGTAKVVPGCKHVAIGIGPDAKRIYLLDITRSQIVVLARTQPAADQTAQVERPAEKEKH